MTKKVFIFIFLIFSILGVFVFVSLYYLSQNTKTDLLYFPKLLRQAKDSPSLNTPFNFIILGLDPRNDKLEKTETTDTIIMANLSSQLKLNLISLPRDLWDYSLKTKINQIYQLSIGQTEPFAYIQNNYQRLVGQNIDRTIIITTQNLINLTDLIGGVDLYLDQGFKDEKYPNPEYIKNPSPNISVYKTIEFPQGWVHLDKSNISEFVRSRKSSETAASGGTDIGRIKRQQLLIDALIKKLKNPDFLKSYSRLFSLYNYFHSEIQTNLTDLDLFSLILQNYRQINNFSLNKIEISTGENPKTDLLYHPQTFINKQWVFIPQDINYQSLHQFISNSINGQN